MILYSKYINGKWTSPKLADFSGKYFDGGPFFSHDGKKLYFYSRRPLNEKSNKETDGEIWYIEKKGSGWSNPHHLKIDKKGDKLFFSLSNNNNLYFTSGHGPRGIGSGDVDIFCMKFVNGSYTKPKKLPEPINTREYLESDVLISPDETYLIFYSLERPGNIGQYDLYISFKMGDRWSMPVNLGENINKGVARFPRFSPDGKYLFFTRRDGIYWVSTKIFENLKPKELK
ncbi:MAG: PD40 domain-containing protein [Candidatus Aminicenantes bacterium]|nr:PD40 domain-containing protein [Candidatus Aminicenantes bacterium]